MAAAVTKVTLNRRAWLVPSEGRALKGWAEATAAKRIAEVVRIRQQRDAWQPNPQAWYQLVQLQSFVGRRVMVQFWPFPRDDDNWPDPGEGHCEGVITLIDFGHLQAFLLLRDAVNTKTGEQYDSEYLDRRSAINCTLAAVADLYEVESIS